MAKASHRFSLHLSAPAYRALKGTCPCGSSGLLLGRAQPVRPAELNGYLLSESSNLLIRALQVGIPSRNEAGISFTQSQTLERFTWCGIYEIFFWIIYDLTQRGLSSQSGLTDLDWSKASPITARCFRDVWKPTTGFHMYCFDTLGRTFRTIIKSS